MADDPILLVPTPRNTPIEKLLEEYANDGCDFSDMKYVKTAALRYVWTMKDCQARVLLYILATQKD